MPDLRSTGVKIASLAHCLPERAATNKAIIDEHAIRLNPEWVRLNIGIEERRWASDGETPATLAADVLRQLLQGRVAGEDSIGALIVSTVSSEWMTPAVACMVQSMVTPGAVYPCFDITAACSGFVYALDIGRRYVQTGVPSVACIATEIRSRSLNKQDRRTVMLFGDGAAGAVLEPCQPGEVGIIYSRTMADGRYWDAIAVPVGGHITMKEATFIFSTAIQEMAQLVRGALEACGMTIDGIDQFIFHQASGVIVDKVAEHLAIPPEKYYKNFQTRGNMTSASVAVALSEAVSAGRIRRHDHVCLVATGGGFSAGIVILRWEC